MPTFHVSIAMANYACFFLTSFSTAVPKRPVRPKWSRIFPSTFDDLMTTGFGDCSPVLLTTRASYDDLNSRMERPVSELRFRSNIIVRTDDDMPFAVRVCS